MQATEWKLPLNLAIGIHVLILLGAIYLPGIFKSKPKFADIYTVSIINIAEPSASPPAAVTKTKPTPPAPAKIQKTAPPPVVAPPVKAQKIAPIAETPKKVEEAPKKAISLKPLKKKIIQEAKPTENIARKEDLERKQRLQRQKLAEALREEELLAEKAKLAQEALETERKLLQSQQQQVADNSQAFDSLAASSAVSGNRTQTSAATSGGSTNLLESQYLASVFNRLHQFWTPPEYLQDDPNLTAVVVITINLDGTVADMLFENKSGNRIFDQFVSKTIEAASPMPPIPPAMKKQRFEIGLRFRPGSIQ